MRRCCKKRPGLVVAAWEGFLPVSQGFPWVSGFAGER